MLQSEFFGRTHITLTGEEYAEVECLYNAVKMDKDEFCKYWVSEKENPLFKELTEAYLNEVSRHRADVTCMERTCGDLRREYDELRKKKDKEIDDTIKTHNNIYREFAKKIIRTQSDNPKIMSVVEEEFGYDFILKTKYESDIPFSDYELGYLVGKL